MTATETASRPGWDLSLTLSHGAIDQTLQEAMDRGFIPRSGQGTYAFGDDAKRTMVKIDAVVSPWRIVDGKDDRVTAKVALKSGKITTDEQVFGLSGVVFTVTAPLRLIGADDPNESHVILSLDFEDKQTVAVPSMKALASQAPRADLVALNAVLTDFFFDCLSGGAVDLLRVDRRTLGKGRKWLAARDMMALTGRSEEVGAAGFAMASLNPAPRDRVLPADIIAGVDGGASFVISNEILTRVYLVPVLAAALGVDRKQVIARPGRPWSVALSGAVQVGDATVEKARALIQKGKLQIQIDGQAKFWGGTQAGFRILSSYEAVVGGTVSDAKLAFRRTGRDLSKSVHVGGAAKAVTFGTTGLQDQRADETLSGVMERVAPVRLGKPFPLEFLSALQWPFGRSGRLRSAALPGSLNLSFEF
ncbi:MAG: hypothetical protein AAGF59_04020 [Pseudomonadota bacterium]